MTELGTTQSQLVVFVVVLDVDIVVKATLKVYVLDVVVVVIVVDVVDVVVVDLNVDVVV